MNEFIFNMKKHWDISLGILCCQYSCMWYRFESSWHWVWVHVSLSLGGVTDSVPCWLRAAHSLCCCAPDNYHKWKTSRYQLRWKNQYVHSSKTHSGLEQANAELAEQCGPLKTIIKIHYISLIEMLRPYIRQPSSGSLKSNHPFLVENEDKSLMWAPAGWNVYSSGTNWQNEKWTLHSRKSLCLTSVVGAPLSEHPQFILLSWTLFASLEH